MASLLRHSALLRHPIGDLPIDTLPHSSTPRRLIQSALISHEGLHGDRSFLLIRERRGSAPAGDRIVLRGEFGAPAQEHLACLLAGLSAAGRQPVQIDLRRVTFLDKGCLRLLLKARRDLAESRPVFFQVAEAGSIREMTRPFALGKSAGPSSQGLTMVSGKRKTVPSAQPVQQH